jgi:hypothetical protein
MRIRAVRSVQAGENQLASIVLFHAASESHGILRVKKNVQLLMD